MTPPAAASAAAPPTRWLTAEQLGPAFDDGGRILLLENHEVFRRRPTHRQKAHLYLVALRQRARELGDRGALHRVRRYRDALTDAALVPGELEVIDPPSWAARRLVRELGASILPARGFVTGEEQFAAWAAGRTPTQLVMDRFYREVRERTGILMQGGQPVGGQFSFDADNRQPPPKGAVSLGLPDAWQPVEDDIDAAVHAARQCYQAVWQRMAPVDRGRLLQKLSAKVLEHADELTALEQRDCGKPTSQAAADAAALARYFEFYAGACDKFHGETIPYQNGYSVFTWRQPHGVTGHVIPWNYPMQIFGRSVGGALAAGNCCVVKPAEDACLSLIRVAQLAAGGGKAKQLAFLSRVWGQFRAAIAHPLLSPLQSFTDQHLPQDGAVAHILGR